MTTLLLKKVCIIIALFSSQGLCFTTTPLQVVRVGPAAAAGRTYSLQNGVTAAAAACLHQLHVLPQHPLDNNNENMNNNNNNPATAVTLLLKRAKTFAAASMLTASLSLLLLLNPHLVAVQPAMAAESRIVGQLQGSGLVFKDTLQIESFEDPKVKGVTLYISNFQRPLTERLTSNFLADPSYASVACAKTGKTIAIADTIAKGKAGEQVFEESRSLLFKTLRVQRIYDEESNTMVYVSFATRLDKSDDSNKARFKSSLCAINLNE